MTKDKNTAAAAKTSVLKPERHWETLVALIEDYAEASVQDAWKDGGDPLSIPEVEAYLALARAKLNGHIAFMKRELE